MNNKGDNMSDPIVVPSMNSYVIRIMNIIKDFSKKIQLAPERKGYDPIFRVRIPAKWTVKNERNACIREIAEEATIFGYDLSGEFANLKSLTEEVEQE